MEERKTKEKVICDAVCGLVMLMCVMAYLIIGIFTNQWHPYWIIPACGGIVCAVVSLVFNTIANVKEIDKQNKNSQE